MAADEDKIEEKKQETKEPDVKDHDVKQQPDKTEKGLLNNLLGNMWKRKSSSRVKSLIRMEDENLYHKVSKFDSRPKIDSYNDMEADNIDEDVDELEE